MDAFLRVEFEAAVSRISQLDGFYAEHLGLEPSGEHRFWCGESELVFKAGPGEPFYHFAFLVPGDRFDDALAWARARVDLLPGGDADEVIFDFAAWNALAFYFLDPAENIVELIAHRGLAESGRTGDFVAAEFIGFSEVGLVGDPTLIAAGLERLGVRLWDGSVGPGDLAFFGERGKVLILSPEERGWLPNRRPAQASPVDLLLSGASRGDVTVCGHRIRQECRATGPDT